MSKVQDAFLKVPFEERIPFETRPVNRIDRIVIEFDPVERKTTLTLQGVVSYGGQRINFRWSLYKEGELWEGDYDDISIDKGWFSLFLPEEIEEIYDKIGNFCEYFLYSDV